MNSRKAKRKQIHKQKSGQERAHRWNSWLQGPARILTEIGLPRVLISDKTHWRDFLIHGAPHECDPGLGFDWTVESLPEGDQHRLLGFLAATLGDEEKQGSALYRHLQEVLVYGPRLREHLRKAPARSVVRRALPTTAHRGHGLIDVLTIPESTVRLEDGSEHRVEALQIARQPVAQSEYDEFVAATKRETTLSQDGLGETCGVCPGKREHVTGTHMNIGVSGLRRMATRLSWYDAAACCEWLGGRLPTEMEWLAAAIRLWDLIPDSEHESEFLLSAISRLPDSLSFEGPVWTATPGATPDVAVVRSGPILVLEPDWQHLAEAHRTVVPKWSRDIGAGLHVCMSIGPEEMGTREGDAASTTAQGRSNRG